MHKDNVELICSVGELAAMFEKRSNVRGFLDQVVQVVARHMKAQVCSVYLYDESTRSLVLQATHGLNATSVGDVRLQLGEGVTGAALERMTPVREARAPRSPYFKHVPDVDEDDYEAFLAVPILRGLARVGVLTVQHSDPGYFDENDARALKAIASQLATTLENAKLIMEIHDQTGVAGTAASSESFFVRGRVASEGIGLGRAMLLQELTEGLPDPSETDIGGMEEFDQAIERTEAQLEQLQHAMDERFSDVASLIFSSHLLMLRDEEFYGTIAGRIQEGLSAYRAVAEVTQEYIRLFAASGNDRTREKTQDVRDLGHRILQNLVGQAAEHGDYHGQIVVARELLPSQLLRIAAQNAEGIVMYGGSASAHVAILARSLSIPVLFCEDERIFSLPDPSYLILDAYQGNLFVNPSEEVSKQYREIVQAHKRTYRPNEERETETKTACGARVFVLANINLLSDLTVARRYSCEGVGLYRSEFPYLIRDDFPSEEEQVRIYGKLMREMDDRPVLLRTLDVGGDKLLSYMSGPREANPFLGLRAIRFSLRNTTVFQDQLRAMLRAGAERNLGIMFPLVSSLDDFLEAKEHVDGCIRSLQAEGITHNPRPRIGAMVELPSSVELAAELAESADFLSIGTNDLIQYLLGVDRTNEHVAHLYTPYHPAVFRSVNRLARAGQAVGCEVSVCGDAAGDKIMIPFFIGIGIRHFSVEPKLIPLFRRHVHGVTVEECEAVAQDLLSLRSAREVREYLRLS
jgi:phosphotransferase system, enzyme I, PtsP